MTDSQPVIESARPEAGDRRNLHAEELALAALAVLSLVGIAITDFSARQSLRYWIVMVPIFAAVSLFCGWSRARGRGQSMPTILRQQLLHWSVLPVAIYLVYALHSTGRLDRQDAGLVALLALALTTFLAGVHFDWRMAVLGAALAAGALLAALVDQFFWIFLIVAIPMIAFVLWRRRRSSRDGAV